MATATKKSQQGTPVPPKPPASGGKGQGVPPTGILKVVDSIYRFLASVKLAVIVLALLAGVLSYATFYESRFGTAAVNEYIYRTKWFEVLLAFLGINVTCAATIRYPWTKRQTGFVITHIGLIVLILGSWWDARTADEGQVAMLEGQVSNTLVRQDASMIRLRELDPHTGKATTEFALPLHGGPFDWEPGRYQLISAPKDPFKVGVKSYYAASIPKTVHVKGEGGRPMIELRPRIKPPRSSEFMEVIQDEHDRWLEIPPETRLSRAVKTAGPAQFAFLYVDRPEMVEDFLNPPAIGSEKGTARLRYVDKAGKPRFYDWPVDESKVGQPFPLPDSDITVAFSKISNVPLEDPALARMLGDVVLRVAQFKVKKGDGPQIDHNGFAQLPMVPSILPSAAGPDGKPPEAIVNVGYHLAPTLAAASDAPMSGRFGVIEVMGDDSGKLAYRVWGRGEPGKPAAIRAKGPLELKKEIVAFGGNDKQPMTLVFQVDDYLLSGVEKQICESIEMPKEQRGNGLAAALVEITVGNETKEVWVRRPPAFEPIFERVSFGEKVYEVAFDCDRREMGFDVKLDDFDVGFDPGTTQAATFTSKVRLTDKLSGISDKPITITMNEPMHHNGWTFYQSSYIPHKDAQGRDTGEFQSVFQVATHPGRPVIYAGCLLVVLGTFVQFYMRAGVFTDGGKKERERAEAKVARLVAKANGHAGTNGHAAPKTSAPKPADNEIDI